ncbi:cell membrane substrate S-adenosyl-methyltransferase [Mesoplasma florum L1]|uniref:Ribosomal RNA small subunit methyltransferase H n=2 Tax=Mesoplasma florum TaxID=2151 RepID=RSMH_MESFL|nr:16S rRNA (cytosine(1402)-N(4))-methyltransferase RsmH [Mesoplasma florum]Q6F170.1 RecName: Full=Ribosomal RNA small subunit methyltransferase H; AltName: Full=16S rRNA m(4)C1402 methyltransferase; AltName: Full=rRNA (cytosine-N(4)-)-methyltransferase RsmH [Mesoplasma florum L1]AAT75753.1 cell membrane substrate S-adenosyl-methyltransferase [Mesoplasma florum L1]AGY41484.1 rRNA small subunit methyltransferase H [Mesoplasma florum W37]ATI73356.1 ribosomal RNA small subunit methyltransferase H 
MEKHIPVLLKESIEYLNIKENGIYVDCTLGRAGHSSEILKKLKDGKLFSIDQDETAILEGTEKLTKISNNFKILEGNFVNISAMLAMQGIFEVDGILYDLGVSSPQFDVAERGFSYRFDGPLDMRMDRANNSLTAHKIVNEYTQEELEQILWNYGDEKFARSIAKNIILSRPINTTFELVSVIKKSLPAKILKQQKHPAKKTFQALRIRVNNEMETLESSLEQSLNLLKPKGRVVVITFHSLEEKVVKNIFKKYTLDEQQFYLSNLPYEIESSKDFKLLFKKPLKPTNTEVENNNRSHSAKLWVIEKK